MSGSGDFYILTKSHESIWPGGVVLLWGPNRRGYSTTLEGAGRYSRAEATEIAVPRDSQMPQQDFMVPCEVLESAAVRVVDVDKFAELTKHVGEGSDGR